MSAEQLAAFALLGMQKFTSPSPSDGIVEANNINKKLKDFSNGDAGALFPIASTKHRNSTDKYSSKKHKARNLCRPLPLKKRKKFEPSLHSKEPVSPLEKTSPQSHVPCITPEKRNPVFSTPDNLKGMTFAEKLHHLLGQDELQDCIAWVPHGRAFRILDKLLLERYVLQTYFGYTDYSKFVNELEQHGLKKFTVNHGNEKNVYYHEYFVRGMPQLAEFVTKSQQLTGTADSSLHLPALPRMTAAVSQTKKPVIQVDMQSHQDLLVQDLAMKQLLQQPPLAFPKAAAAQSSSAPNFTSEQEVLQYLLAGSIPPAFLPAPAPQPSAQSNALLLQNALTEIFMGNNPLVPIMNRDNVDQGIHELLMDPRALQILLQQPQFGGPNGGTTPFFLEQLNQQDQSMLLANVLGLQSIAPAPALFSPPGHDSSLAALNLQRQAMQPSQPKIPDLQSALLTILLQHQG